MAPHAVRAVELEVIPEPWRPHPALRARRTHQRQRGESDVITADVHDPRAQVSWRVEAAQARKPRGSAVLQLERLYQAEEKLLHAKLKAAETESEAHSAEADWLAMQCQVLRLQGVDLQLSLRS